MADAVNPVANIYEGVWTDWSKGKVTGITLTLGPTTATVVTSALALFVTFTGLQLWAIARLVIHQQGASVPPFMQTPHLGGQQLILRNATGAVTTARQMLDLAWNKRHETGRRSLRAYAIGIFAISYAMLLMVAGLFSDKLIRRSLINGGSPVLQTSQICGVWNETYYDTVKAAVSWDTLEGMTLATAYQAKRANEGLLSHEYAQACYLADAAHSNLSETCNIFKRSSLSWNTTTAPCPFPPEICHKNAPTIVLDTGDINSHDDLGINAPPKERLTYRRVTKCSVLNETDRIKGWDGIFINASSPGTSADAARAYFGPSIPQKTEYTYSYSNFASFYDNFTWHFTKPYFLSTDIAFAPMVEDNLRNGFAPIPELVQENADLSLFFLSFIGMYLQEVDDPWFSAHAPYHFNVPQLPFMENRFARDSAISALGCIETHNFCTPEGVCTGPQGFDQVQDTPDFLAALSPKQNATFDRILWGVLESTLYTTVELLTNVPLPPLLATNATTAGKSGAIASIGLPDNQWQMEVNYWHSIAMAQLQRQIALWATGQISPEPKFLDRPSTHQDKWFCKNFMVPSGIYSSFSLLAIILVMVFGVLVISASLMIEHWLPQKHWDRDHFTALRRRFTKISKRQSPMPSGNLHQSRFEFGFSKPDLATNMATPVLRSDRASSQALPAMSPQFSFVQSHSTSPEMNDQLAFRSVGRSRRETGMIISLNDLNFAAPDTAHPTQQLQVERNIAVLSVPQPAMFSRYHCGRPEHYYTGCHGRDCK